MIQMHLHVATLATIHQLLILYFLATHPLQKNL